MYVKNPGVNVIYKRLFLFIKCYTYILILDVQKILIGDNR